MLLSAVHDATARLTVVMNSSNFIYHSHQQADQDVTDDDSNDLSTPRNNHDGTFSFKWTASKRCKSRSLSSRPTVLKIGLISDAKNTNGSRMMSAQRVGRGNSKSGLSITKSSSHDYSFLNKSSLSPDSILRR